MQIESLLQDLSIVIPAYNEGPVIGRLLEELRRLYPAATVIVVDDGSSDNTPEEVARVAGVHYIRHQYNIGYGASIRNGVREARTRVVCWFDSDGQHAPEDVLKVALPVLRGEVHAGFGVRTGYDRQQLKRVPGKAILSWLSGLIAAQNIPDINCGLRAFDRRILVSYLHLLPNQFSASLTTTLLMIKRGYNIRWVDIQMRPRVGNSTVSILRDGLKSLKILFRLIVLFSALRFFATISVLLFLVGMAWGAVTLFVIGSGISAPAVGAMVSSLLIFLMGLLIDQIAEMRKERLEIPEDVLCSSAGVDEKSGTEASS